jgi:hypothetical protein
MSFPMEFHPEFGFLAPSPQVRRVIRTAAIAALIGAVFGGAGVFALGARSERAGGPAEPGLAVAQTAEDISTVGGPLVLASHNASEPVVSAKPCKEQTWPYLDRKCLTGIVTRWRHVRVLPPDARAEAGPINAPELNSEGVKPSEPSATPSKKRKSAKRRSRNRDEGDTGNDFASSREPRQDRGDRSYRSERGDRGDRRSEPQHNDGGNWFFGR